MLKLSSLHFEECKQASQLLPIRQTAASSCAAPAASIPETQWLNSTVKAENEKLVINGKPISYLPGERATTIKWGDACADHIAEFTGVTGSTTMEKAGAHLKGGAERVITLPLPVNAPMFLTGVNHENHDNSLKIVSSVSCTINCLASLAKVIQDNSGIMEGLMTTIHAITATQKTVDGPSGKLCRDGRLHLCFYRCPKAVGKVVPELKEKLTGTAFRVPIHEVSVMDLTCLLEKTAKYNDIRKVVKQASEGPLKGVAGYPEDKAVSCDFNSDTPSLMPGLALLSMTTLPSPFPGMTMNLATATGCWTLWSIWPPRHKSPLDH
ncbi:LOW QUALITY PROTEIN: glyceraldehyde-3-phosphate dehydrogenase-like [Ursus americanus]|uniref:LOW QUALITY PROTEIN: glyceraldehyde-3-phosphate dehydrogenase-like n=1 Tax=Ursus americanus TaxID=9643 RepID=UPI001E67A042|nr:LOW QUALITY PROTEIN: glyceraldehyde-3-phosphate dehydrogenase-like [Ursus americanus]